MYAQKHQRYQERYKKISQESAKPHIQKEPPGLSNRNDHLLQELELMREKRDKIKQEVYNTLQEIKFLRILRHLRFLN